MAVRAGAHLQPGRSSTPCSRRSRLYPDTGAVEHPGRGELSGRRARGRRAGRATIRSCAATTRCAWSSHVPWHPSVKALVAMPEVLARMDESPAWLHDLGEAYRAHGSVRDGHGAVAAPARAGERQPAQRQRAAGLLRRQQHRRRAALPQCCLRALLRSVRGVRGVVVAGVSPDRVAPICAAGRRDQTGCTPIARSTCNARSTCSGPWSCIVRRWTTVQS